MLTFMNSSRPCKSSVKRFHRGLVKLDVACQLLQYDPTCAASFQATATATLASQRRTVELCLSISSRFGLGLPEHLQKIIGFIRSGSLTALTAAFAALRLSTLCATLFSETNYSVLCVDVLFRCDRLCKSSLHGHMMRPR
jgi:hypothetical protein